ncbi:MAG: hypothetical protein GXO89_14085 [Chlorobi bacterium]|nr:hypothetical protein [Chlorobiota bacterium]
MKKTTLNTLLLIFTIVVPISAFSQKNLFPGYIISLNGDTVKGYIKYKNWEYNPDQISFWEKRDGEAVIYNPGEIKMFGVEGDEVYKCFCEIR